MKRITILLLVFSLLIGAMTGCSSKDGKGRNKTDAISTKGRYVDEDIDFPSGVDEHGLLSFVLNPDGDIELYVDNSGEYEKYIYAEKTWSKEDFKALDKFNNHNRYELSISTVFYGEDEKLYILCDVFPSYYNSLYRLSDTGEFEQVDVSAFKETYEEWNNIAYRPKSVKVLENGMIAAVYPWKEIEVYSSDGQSVVAGFSGGRSGVMAVNKNTVYYSSQNDKELLSMDMEKDEPGIARPLDIEISEKGFIECNDEAVYICDVTGIHLNKEGGSIWETIVDGNQGGLNIPTLPLADFILGNKDDYYVVLKATDEIKGISEDGVSTVLSDRNSFIIKHIFYDENASSVPPTEISIYSVYDSKTIRQAMGIFGQTHPDVKINYRSAYIGKNVAYTYGIKDPEETITLNDHINALNTELLANKGADILVMDNLPVDSYIEKGVLEDIGDIINPMIESGGLLTNIAGNYVRDGKVYTMPVRFKVPLISGVSEIVDAAESLEGLVRYIQGDNSGIPILDPSNYRSMAAWLLLLYHDQLLNERNEIDAVLLQDFLEDLDVIAKNINASDDASISMNATGTEYGILVGYWTMGPFNVHRKLAQGAISEAGGIMDYALPLDASKQWEGTVKAINNTFTANTIIGLNSASTQKELAKEFIELLFSEAIQDTELMDGFPVRKAAMESLVKKNKVSDIGFGGPDNYIIQLKYPSLEARENIYEEIRTLSRPMATDMTMIDMILDEAERYLRGDITVEQAAQNSVSSINTYLSE